MPDDCLEIPLKRGRPALIDASDGLEVLQHHWFLMTVGYAAAHVGSRMMYLHRFVMGARKGEFVDHINGDKLDCRRSNLRICTQSQNGANRKRITKQCIDIPYKGIKWHRNIRRWGASICFHRKSIHLGCFDTPELAALAYDVAARACWGEFATPNFPEDYADSPDVERMRGSVNEICKRLIADTRRDGAVKKRKPYVTTDPVELAFEGLCGRYGIPFDRPDKQGTGNLDYYLPTIGLHCEMKSWSSERLHTQLRSSGHEQDGIMVLVGIEAVTKLARLFELVQQGGMVQ